LGSHREPGSKQGHRRTPSQIGPPSTASSAQARDADDLWEEHIERHSDGIAIRFCDLYRSWEDRLSVTMCQSHGGGDKLFVDYAGDDVPVIDRHDGYRLMLRRQGSSVRLFTCRGFDWSNRFPAIVEAAASLRINSISIDGEAVVCGHNGVRISTGCTLRGMTAPRSCFAFDLLEIDEPASCFVGQRIEFKKVHRGWQASKD
jgi:hypothetical protein